MKRKIYQPKKVKSTFEKIPDYDEMRLIVYTQPSLTVIGKKKPDVFELVVSGSKDEQLAYAKNHLGKEIKLSDVFKAGEVIDTFSVTKAKGFQGPVKRFGVAIRHHKSEKVIRGPGSLCGGWKAQGHMMYRVAHAGKMGYHQRCELNKWIMKISDNPKEVNPKGGWLRFGEVKNTFMLIKGSVAGSSKRLIRMTHALRANKIPKEEPIIKYISIESKQ